MEDNNPNHLTGAPSFPPPPSHHHLLQQQQQQLQMFWTYQQKEIEQANDFKNHQLPLARIKKIMKSDEDVRMISAESPVIFAKACELFILELTIRSWLHAEENRRRTLQRNDVAAAITRTEIFDFLVDIVPKDEIKEDDGLFGGMVQQDLPCYYSNMAQPVMGQPVMDPRVYGGWQGGEDGAYGGNGQRNDNGQG